MQAGQFFEAWEEALGEMNEEQKAEMDELMKSMPIDEHTGCLSVSFERFAELSEDHPIRVLVAGNRTLQVKKPFQN